MVFGHLMHNYFFTINSQPNDYCILNYCYSQKADQNYP